MQAKLVFISTREYCISPEVKGKITSSEIYVYSSFLQLSAIDRKCVFSLQVKVLRYTLSTVAIFAVCQVFSLRHTSDKKIVPT